MSKSKRPKKVLIQFAVALVLSVVIGGLALFLGIKIISDMSSQTKKVQEELTREKEKLAAEREQLKNSQTQTADTNHQQSYEFVTPTVPVLPGQIITPAMVELRTVNTPTPPGAIKKLMLVMGKTPKIPLPVGEMIYQDNLTDTNDQIQVANGMRAITIELDAVDALNGALTAGAHVDVLCTILGKDGGVTRTILQNTTLVAVKSGSRLPVNAAGEKFLVTVAVTPKQAELLTLASEVGKFNLALRNEADQHKGKVSGSDLSTLIDGEKPVLFSQSKPPGLPDDLLERLPYPGQLSPAVSNFQMQVFRGNGSETIGFKQ
jgi:pilus assembly protein CpaB